MAGWHKRQDLRQGDNLEVVAISFLHVPVLALSLWP